MSRIRLVIDRLVLNGIEPGARKPLVEALQKELSQLLGRRATRADWARSHRTPVLKLGHMALEPGASGGRKLGEGLARNIGKGLRP